MADYIPNTDADFNTWQANFCNYLSANLAALGLTAADLAAITAAKASWETAYADDVAKQAVARGTNQAKTSARDGFETILRAVTQQVQARPNVADSQRAGLGINIRETARTPTGVPDSRPVGTIDTSQRLRHTINFSDESTPSRRAKPDGVMGCQIWAKVGDPAPVDPSELRFLATDTATPYVAEYDGTDAHKVAHYMLRWVNRKGETGPWSQTVSATITG